LAARSRGVEAKVVANWVTGELFRLLRAGNVEITACQVTPDRLAELIALVSGNVVTMATGKQVLQAIFATGRAASDIVWEQGLGQIVDEGSLAEVIEEVIAANPGPVGEYKRGKKTVLRFLVGRVMRLTGGKANPVLAADLLAKRLRD